MNDKNTTLDLEVIAVKKETFTDKQTGQPRTLWKATVILPDGDTAVTFATFDVKRGEWMAFEPKSTKEGRLTLKARSTGKIGVPSNT